MATGKKETRSNLKGGPGPGRPKGVPNRATTLFRDTISAILSDNAPMVQKWLLEVAKGREAELHPIDGTVLVKAIPPDPGKALDLMSKLAEYAAPKLGRIEHVGDPANPLQHQHAVDLSGLSDEQKRALASIKLPDDQA